MRAAGQLLTTLLEESSTPWAQPSIPMEHTLKLWKVLNTAGVPSEQFRLAGDREQFRFNYTTGAIEPVPAFDLAFVAKVSGEIPRYIQTWSRVFAPLSVPGFKVSGRCETPLESYVANKG